MFCRGCGGFHVFFRRLQGLFAVKMMCENGKSIVRIWWFGFAISVEINCVTAVAWCVSGVFNTDFTNFTKHSTVLTSILQQINTLYQHFQSAETAKPALEQAKTMLKIALPTFKNDENHTQNSKILYENCKMYAVFGGFMIDCCMFCRGCGGFHVFFRRLRCLFAVKMMCENGKIWCENCENVVRIWWLGFAISAEIHCVTAVA